MAAEHSKVPPRIPHEVLLSLLYKPGYRDKWAQHVQRRRGTGINQRAVAAFIAYELSDRLGKDIDPATIKDRVARALKGEVVTEATAEMFIEAFEFETHHANELRRSVLAHDMIRRVLEAPKDPAKRPDDRVTGCTSLNTIIDCSVDAFGFPRYFDVTEVFSVDTDELTEYDLRFEAVPSQCELLEGGTLKAYNVLDGTPLVGDDSSIYQLIVEFERPLTRGEVHQIRYRTHIDIKASLNELSGLTFITAGPFFPARYNVTLSARFDDLPIRPHQKVWANVVDDATLLVQEDLPAQRYCSITYPMAEDIVLSLWWDRDHQGARQHYNYSPLEEDRTALEGDEGNGG